MSGYRKSASKPTDLLVGIDFGTTKICVVIGRETPDGLEIVGIGKQPSLGIRKGVVVNIPMTVEALAKAVEAAELMAGCEIGNATAGIAGGHIKSFNSAGVVALKEREVTRHDMERAVEAAKAIAIPSDREVLHVIPQEFIVNDQEGVRDPIGMAGTRLEAKVHVVTGAVASAQNIIRCANRAGVDVTDIVLEPLASAEAVLTADERELGVALIDIGGGTTDVALFARGSVVHTAVVAMGGNHITNDVAVGLRCAIDDAENLKVALGCALERILPEGEERAREVPILGGSRMREVTRGSLARIIEPRVEEILELVGREIAASGYRHLVSTGLVLTGGSSLLEGLPELAEFVLDMPVRLGAPRGVGGLGDVVGSPVYATAVGLLRHAARNRARVRFRAREDANVYGRVVSRMKSWLSDVF